MAVDIVNMTVKLFNWLFSSDNSVSPDQNGRMLLISRTEFNLFDRRNPCLIN